MSRQNKAQSTFLSCSWLKLYFTFNFESRFDIFDIAQEFLHGYLCGNFVVKSYYIYLFGEGEKYFFQNKYK